MLFFYHQMYTKFDKTWFTLFFLNGTRGNCLTTHSKSAKTSIKFTFYFIFFLFFGCYCWVFFPFFLFFTKQLSTNGNFEQFFWPFFFELFLFQWQFLAVINFFIHLKCTWFAQWEENYVNTLFDAKLVEISERTCTNSMNREFKSPNLFKDKHFFMIFNTLFSFFSRSRNICNSLTISSFTIFINISLELLFMNAN